VEWTQQMAKVRASLGYRLTQNIRLAAEMKRGGIVWPALGGALAGLLGGLALGVWLYRRACPPPLAIRPVRADLAGIGGWLLLPAFAILIRPFALFNALKPTLALIDDRPSWIASTDPESVGLIAGFAPVALAEIAVGVCFIAWSLVLIPQFFTRKRSFPPSVILYLASFAGWAVVHMVWMRQLAFPNPASLESDLVALGQLGFAAAIWIPYFRLSERVRATFTR
jgi:Protein of unknown function (DUF2569)